jgi:hypothetical protein
MENKLNKLAHLLVKKFSILPSKYYNELFFTDIYNKLVIIYDHCLQNNSDDDFWNDVQPNDNYTDFLEYCDELAYLIVCPDDKTDDINHFYESFANEINSYTLAYLVTNFSELKINCGIPDDYAEFIEE